MLTCKEQPVSGAQVNIGGPYPSAASAWTGTTEADGGFSTGPALTAGTYVVSIGWTGGGFDSTIAQVPNGGFAYIAAECTEIGRPIQ